MRHTDNRPNRKLSTRIVAGTIAALGMLGVGACASPEVSAQATHSAEAASTVPAHSTATTPVSGSEATPKASLSPEVSKSQKRFESAAHESALKLLTAMVNPDSQTSAYDASSFGNSNSVQQAGSMKPNLSVTYTKGTPGEASSFAINAALPLAAVGAPNTPRAYDQMTIVMALRDGSADPLQTKLDAHQQLSLTDFEAAVTDRSFGMHIVTTQQGPNQEATQIMANPDGTYQYAYYDGVSQGFGPVKIDDQGRIRLDEFTTIIEQSTQAVENAL